MQRRAVSSTVSGDGRSTLRRSSKLFLFVISSLCLFQCYARMPKLHTFLCGVRCRNDRSAREKAAWHAHRAMKRLYEEAKGRWDISASASGRQGQGVKNLRAEELSLLEAWLQLPLEHIEMFDCSIREAYSAFIEKAGAHVLIWWFFHIPL